MKKFVFQKSSQKDFFSFTSRKNRAVILMQIILIHFVFAGEFPVDRSALFESEVELNTMPFSVCEIQRMIFIEAQTEHTLKTIYP